MYISCTVLHVYLQLNPPSTEDVNVLEVEGGAAADADESTEPSGDAKADETKKSAPEEADNSAMTPVPPSQPKPVRIYGLSIPLYRNPDLIGQ